MQEFITSNWSIIVGAITVVVWLVRLEGKIQANNVSVQRNLERIDGLEDQHTIIEQMALDLREIKTDMKWVKKINGEDSL